MIDGLDLLKLLFREVLIPEAVHREMLQGGVESAGLAAYRQASWIKVTTLNELPDLLLESVLDAGEASVIQLARERGLNIVLIDEKKGRKVARNVYGLRVIGTARVLVEGKRQGHLESVSEPIERMRAGGYWIHNDIVRRALHQAGEIP